jgi:hypothetical protein
MRHALLAQLAQLIEVVDAMQSDLGLSDLSTSERTVLLAVCATAQDTDEGLIGRTEAAREHPIARKMSQPTFHRALRRLIQRDLVCKSDRGPGHYRIKL